jgi:hypothetical protein
MFLTTQCKEIIAAGFIHRKKCTSTGEQNQRIVSRLKLAEKHTQVIY